MAAQAQAVIEGRLKYWDFVDGLPEGTHQDELVAELIDLVEHEPKVGGFLGMSAKRARKVHGASARNNCIAQGAVGRAI